MPNLLKAMTTMRLKLTKGLCVLICVPHLSIPLLGRSQAGLAAMGAHSVLGCENAVVSRTGKRPAIEIHFQNQGQGSQIPATKLPDIQNDRIRQRGMVDLIRIE